MKFLIGLFLFLIYIILIIYLFFYDGCPGFIIVVFMSIAVVLGI